jgi:hypothetical protein
MFLNKLTPLILIMTVACTNEKSSGFGFGNSGGQDPDFYPDDTDTDDTDTDDTDTDTDDTDTDTDTDETGEPPVDEGQTFDEPGDLVVGADDGQGVVEVDLSDSSGDSNTDQEFYLVLVNPADEEIGYSLEYHMSDGEGNPPASIALPNHSKKIQNTPKISPHHQQINSAVESGRLSRIVPSPTPPSETAYSQTDIGIARQDFIVRDSLTDETSYERIGATLWALETSVAIWVDDSVAIDWDYECDGLIDFPAQYNAYGFDNCDLETIASIVDVNIFPNVRGAFGDESDENGDGRVSVVITPVLNQMTRGDDDSDITFVGSYADPTVDLVAYDPDLNPGSDEQEVIYVFAPDEYGFHNPSALTTIDDYTSVELSSQIAKAFYKLISYNQKVLLNEGDPEETWVSLGLGALAADLSGFGSSNFISAWDYLDATHLNSLSEIEESGAITTSSAGGQYLFFRWLVDAYGVEVLGSIVQSADIGAENIETVLGSPLQELVLKWQIALLSSNSTQGDGGLEIDSTTYPPYSPVSFIQAPITNPTNGDNFGANGYQTGIDVGYHNFYMSGGTLPSASENVSRRVRMSHTDHSTSVFGQDFFGYVSKGFSAQVVRLTDIPFDAAQLEIRSSSTDFVVAVIRGSDLPNVNFARDVLYSPTDVNNTILPGIPNNGDPVYGVGEISQSGLTISVSSDGTESTAEVSDTDRWLVDMSNFPTGQSVRIIGWLDHRYSDANGTVAPTDPWMAIVPSEYLPIPTVTGTQQGACSLAYPFGYPYKLLDHLYYQVFLSASPYSTTEMYEPSEDDDSGETAATFDPCGEPEETVTSCEEDWDRDGVLDVNEPTATTFLGQVQIMQCTLAGNDPTGFFPVGLDVIDIDEQDEDDDPTLDRKLNVGGVSADDNEGAYIDIELTGGLQYILVVGASGEGPYEFTLRAITNQ